MNDASVTVAPMTSFDAVGIAKRLGPLFAQRASAESDEDRYVAENISQLKEGGLFEAGVPYELGGGGADLLSLATTLRIIAYHCGSTGLAFSMHTHQVAVPAWRWKNQASVRLAVEPLLKRIVSERIQLLSTGGSDWIDGSGTAEKVEGGYKIRGRKVFTSGAPTGNLLITSAVLHEPHQEPMVLHFSVPMDSPYVKVLGNWRTLGMRGTGSHDVEIDGHFVPEASVSLKRKTGEWHPLFHLVCMIAFPLVYAAYLGIAESARDIAISLAKRKMPTRHAIELAGRMENELVAARLAHSHMVAIGQTSEPSASAVNDVMIGRQLVSRHAISSVEFALELAGGPGFYRSAGLERRFRDVQGARYHALQSGPQLQYAGSMALGLPVDKVY